MENKRSFLRKNIIIVIIILMLFNFIMPTVAQAGIAEWGESDNFWYANTDVLDNDDFYDTDWNIDDYIISEDDIEDAIKEWGDESTVGADFIRDNAKAFNEALKKYYNDGKTTLGQALINANELRFTSPLFRFC